MKSSVSNLAVAIILSLSTVLAVPAIAQNNDTPQSGQGLEISPPIMTLDADPGDTLVAEISLRNITGVDVVTRGEVNDFVARNETGDPRILLDADEESPYPLAAYISNVPNLEIAPRQQEVARIPIVVPEDASPGAHLGVVRFSAVPADTQLDGSQVSLTASIGTLILLNVSGDVEVDLNIEELALSKDGIQGGFFENGPLTAITRLNNSGNVYLQPKGYLRITNVFGSEVAVTPLENESSDPADDAETADEVAFNPTDRNVLPASIRRFEQAIDKPFWFGRYTLTADLTYGPDDSALEESVTFWVIPYKMLGIALLILVTIIFFGRKALGAYKRSIIEKARSQR